MLRRHDAEGRPWPYRSVRGVRRPHRRIAPRPSRPPPGAAGLVRADLRAVATSGRPVPGAGDRLPPDRRDDRVQPQPAGPVGPRCVRLHPSDRRAGGAAVPPALARGDADRGVRRRRRVRRVERAHTQVEEARRRASEERLLIARELHDVLAHNISLINVQAGVALHLLDERPDQARPALAAIKDASKEALGELRSVLDVLRRSEDGSTAPRAPTAGLRDLSGLVERTRAAGLDVTLDVAGEARPVPAGVDLAAFRIVQEALTNVVRHAETSRARVRLDYGDDELMVQVDDDGRVLASAVTDIGDTTDGGGKGIAGMRERVLALGGSFEAGPRPGRGFRVRARFPIDRSTA